MDGSIDGSEVICSAQETLCDTKQFLKTSLSEGHPWGERKFSRVKLLGEIQN